VIVLDCMLRRPRHRIGLVAPLSRPQLSKMKVILIFLPLSSFASRMKTAIVQGTERWSKILNLPFFRAANFFAWNGAILYFKWFHNCKVGFRFSCQLSSLIWGIGTFEPFMPNDPQQAPWGILWSLTDEISRSLIARPHTIGESNHPGETSELGLKPSDVRNQSDRLPAEERLCSSENTSKPRYCHLCCLRRTYLHMCRLLGFL
jgi:hypothetical protein